MIDRRYSNIILILLLTAIFNCSCIKRYNESDYHNIVIEGWIDNGQNPVVIVTKSIFPGLNNKKMTVDISYVGIGAKVIVSTEDQTETLEGKIDTHYVPPYVFTTDKIIGEAGKTYNLSVEWDEYTATASTTVPLEQAVIDSFKVKPDKMTDSLLTIAAYVSNPNKCKYLNTFIAAQPEQDLLMSSFFGTFKGEYFEKGNNMVTLSKPLKSALYHEDYFSNFRYGDSVTIKFSCIDSLAFTYWNNFNFCTSVNNNAMAGEIRNLKANIEGGEGYWFGYNSSVYTLLLPEKSEN